MQICSYLLRCCHQMFLQVLKLHLVHKVLCVDLLLHWRWPYCHPPIGYCLLQVLEHPKKVPPTLRRRHWSGSSHGRGTTHRRAPPGGLTVRSGDTARLGEEGVEDGAAADNGVRGEAAEVALDRDAPLVHEVVPLHDLPLDDALVGPCRYEEAAVCLREAVGERHDVAEAPTHAELAAVGHPSGDEVGDVAGRAWNDANGSGRGLRVLPRLGDSDLSEPRRRLAGLRRGRSGVGSRGRRELLHPIILLLVQKRAVVLAGGGRGGGRGGRRWTEQGVGRGRDTDTGGGGGGVEG